MLTFSHISLTGLPTAFELLTSFKLFSHLFEYSGKTLVKRKVSNLGHKIDVVYGDIGKLMVEWYNEPVSR